jgi:peptidoglycan/LPS O-acetylase OafA/YrhL
MQVHLPVLTALRGIAAWWVVLYHFREATGLPERDLLMRLLGQGYLAVDFFFILSGFVIFISYERKFLRPSWHAYGSFLWRRIARIYPLHFVILCAFIANPLAIHLFSSARAGDVRYDPLYFLASLVLVQNWGGFTDVAWNIPAWSISAELAAYLLFPWILMAVAKSCKGLAAHFAGAAAIAAALAGIFSTTGCANIGDDIPGLGAIRCILEFSLGVIAGQLFRGFRATLDMVAVWNILAAGLLLIAMVLLRLPNYTVVPLAFFLAILGLASTPMQNIPALSSRTLVYLGEISYSTYLVHYLVKDWTKFLSPTIGPPSFVIYVLVVLAASALLYHCIELPGKAWVLGILERRERRGAT